MKETALFFYFILAGMICRAQHIPEGMPGGGLVGWYPFSGNANDVSGMGNDGRVLGDVQLTADRFGNVNSAYMFSGKPGAKIKVTLAEPLTLNSRSFSCWIRFPVTAATWYPTIFSTLQGGDYVHILGNHPSYEAMHSVGKLYWSWIPGKEGIFSKHFFNDNNWHHVVLVADQKVHEYMLYCDGQLDNVVASGNTTLIIDSLAFAYQNAQDPASSCIGSLDDIAIYDRALSAGEVLRLFKLEMPGNIREPEGVQTESDFTVAADAEQQELTVTVIRGPYDAYIVTDKAGKVLMKQFISNTVFKIDISRLKPGTYNLTLEREGRDRMVHFIKSL